MRRRTRRRITQTEIDFLCLAVFGARSLPDAMAARIALRRELARGLADAFDRASPARSPEPAPLEVVGVVG